MIHSFFNNPGRRTRSFLCTLICIVSLLLLAKGAAFGADGNEVSVTLTPQQFSTQQPARLAITLEGKQAAEIEVPNVEGLVFHQRGQSSQFQMINGKSSYSVTYTYLVQGTKPGEYTIGPITVKTKNGLQKTEPIVCRVADSPTTLPQHRPAQVPATGRVAENQLENVAFIKLIPDKETTYVGELIPTTIKAYFERSVKFQFNALPELIGDGFLMDKLGNEPRQQEEIIGNRAYMVLTWNTVLTGIKEGLTELRMVMDVTMLTRSKQQRRRLPGFGGGLQDDFFDDFFGRYEEQPIRVESPLISMNIRSLPEQGKPDNFSGAIGTFTLDMQAQPTAINEGDPVTLTMSITGSGNFDNVSAPSLIEPDGIKIYSPTSSFTKGSNPEKSRKEFEQAIVITDSRIKKIPPVIFNYFDPFKEQYQTLLTDPIPIIISGAQHPASQLAQQNSPREQIERESSGGVLPFVGLAPVKLSTGTFSSTITPPFRKPLFLLIAALLLAAIAGVTGFRLRTQYLAGHPAILHRQKVEKQRKHCIQTLGQIQSTDHAGYLKTSRQSLQDFLALIWGCEAASITTADIQTRLGASHPVTELFIHSDNASYGASEFSNSQRNRLHTEILEIIATLS